MMEHVAACISERRDHIGCWMIVVQQINNANECISVHALMDQGQDVCMGAFVCLFAHMYVDVCEGQSSQSTQFVFDKV